MGALSHRGHCVADVCAGPGVWAVEVERFKVYFADRRQKDGRCCGTGE